MPKTADKDQTAIAEVSTNGAESKNGKELKLVTLRSAHDFGLASTALEHRSEELKKLAKKNSQEGYIREARAIEADVEAIERAILPQFRSQRELPLADDQALQGAVAGVVRKIVRKAFVNLDDPKIAIPAAEIVRRREQLVETLISRISLFAGHAAREGYENGLAARALTPEGIAGKAISAFKVSDED